MNNLHGIPGIVGGLFSVLMAFLATEQRYGERLYHVYPALAPAANGTDSSPHFEGGRGRTATDQALIQLLSLGVTLAASLLSGLATGLIVSLGFIFDPMDDSQLFQDDLFFQIPGFADDKDAGPEEDLKNNVVSMVKAEYGLGENTYLRNSVLHNYAISKCNPCVVRTSLLRRTRTVSTPTWCCLRCRSKPRRRRTPSNSRGCPSPTDHRVRFN